MPASNTAPRLNATRARQGRWGRHVLWVLVISTALAALALFGSWGMRSNDYASVEHNTKPEASETGTRPADSIAARSSVQPPNTGPQTQDSAQQQRGDREAANSSPQ